MKKPKSKHKSRRNKGRSQDTKMQSSSSVADVFHNLSRPKKQGWVLFALFIFMSVFLGGHLMEAVTSLSIPNIRTTDTVIFSKSPIWFTFTVALKFAFWLFSISYMFLFLKKVWNRKNA